MPQTCLIEHTRRTRAVLNWLVRLSLFGARDFCHGVAGERLSRRNRLVETLARETQQHMGRFASQ